MQRSVPASASHDRESPLLDRAVELGDSTVDVVLNRQVLQDDRGRPSPLPAVSNRDEERGFSLRILPESVMPVAWNTRGREAGRSARVSTW